MATAAINDQKNQHGPRIADVVQEPMKTLPLISSYMDKPVVTLEEAIKPLISFLPSVETHAKMAKQRCYTPPPDGLSVDESASIMLYTMSWNPRDKCFNVALNAALRSEDRSKLAPWDLYLKLFISALDRLPSIQQTIYRGTRAELQKTYPKGKSFVWWGFSSCTSSVDSLRAAVFPGPSTSKTTFAIECKSGKDIRRHAFYSNEDEILLLPATEFKVISAVNHDEDSYMIQLQETASYLSLQQRALVGKPVRQKSTQDPVDDESSTKSSTNTNMLVWLDANLNPKENSFRRTVSKLQHVLKSIHVFTDPEKCMQHLTKSTNKNIFMIISGSFGQNIVPIIHEMPQISSIFVYCGNQAFHEQWAKNWSKIEGIHTEINDISDAIINALQS